MNDIVVATIKKNAMECIQVAWRDFKGRQYLDIRVYADFDRNGEKTPTKKGITILPDLLPELIEALQRAREAEAVSGGPNFDRRTLRSAAQKLARSGSASRY